MEQKRLVATDDQVTKSGEVAVTRKRMQRKRGSGRKKKKEKKKRKKKKRKKEKKEKNAVLRGAHVK